MGIMMEALAAYRKRPGDSVQAYLKFVEFCGGRRPREVPGMATVMRLAHRLEQGRTVEEAAGKEYLYRWHLAIVPPDQIFGDFSSLDRELSIFGTPHTLGM